LVNLFPRTVRGVFHPSEGFSQFYRFSSPLVSFYSSPALGPPGPFFPLAFSYPFPFPTWETKLTRLTKALSLEQHFFQAGPPFPCGPIGSSLATFRIRLFFLSPLSRKVFLLLFQERASWPLLKGLLAALSPLSPASFLPSFFL